MSAVIQEFHTKYHACSLELMNKSFACGTYELDESSTDRQGSLRNYSPNGTPVSTQLELCAGVLDMKIAKDRIAVALSTGCLSLYQWSEGEEGSLNYILDCSIEKHEEGLFLSLDIDLRLSCDCWNEPTKVAVSTQAGSIIIFLYVLASTGSNYFCEYAKINSAHVSRNVPMPVWIVAFNPLNQNQLFSGGDDCTLKLWALSAAAELNEEHIALSNVALNRKTHGAGVTSGQWHPHIKNIFASGSYDEHVRIWDCNDLQRCLLELPVGKTILLLFLLCNQNS
jgi:WD40 repeat protein